MMDFLFVLIELIIFSINITHFECNIKCKINFEEVWHGQSTTIVSIYKKPCVLVYMMEMYINYEKYQ